MKRIFELIASCHFGAEAALKREIIDLGYEISLVEDGRVTFVGDDEAICRANTFPRTVEWVFLKVDSFRAESFGELFQGTKAIAWEEYIPQGGKFWVAETGSSYPLRVFLYKDMVTVGIDTSGDSLHKRGYRTLTSRAPITETLTVTLILLTPWSKDRILVDPFCGNETFPIEVAMMAVNMAPGMKRTFLSEDWKNLIPRKCWCETMDEVNEIVDDTVEVDIQGYDIDGEIVKAARANAEATGVGHMIHFQQRPLNALSHLKKYGFLITNPPYGERIEEKENLPALYREIGERFQVLDSWLAYMITAREDAEKYMGRKVDKNHKIYNGVMKMYSYQFLGPKPPGRKTGDEVEM